MDPPSCADGSYARTPTPSDLVILCVVCMYKSLCTNFSFYQYLANFLNCFLVIRAPMCLIAMDRIHVMLLNPITLLRAWMLCGRESRGHGRSAVKPSASKFLASSPPSLHCRRVNRSGHVAMWPCGIHMRWSAAFIQKTLLLCMGSLALCFRVRIFERLFPAQNEIKSDLKDF
jgi:hypothetical protein